mmetsp:Transcript_6103/g.10426  ORF Transcript_6103/g.10426 Transcript_6103/m.10426 type:complete len:80 (+) Transcript_6103:190-429(+)
MSPSSTLESIKLLPIPETAASMASGEESAFKANDDGAFATTAGVDCMMGEKAREEGRATAARAAVAAAREAEKGAIVRR